jgi:chromosome partitioning protein
MEIMVDFPNLGLAGMTIRDRIAYRKAAKDGMAVCELKPKDPKAVEEMEALYKEVFNDE